MRDRGQAIVLMALGLTMLLMLAATSLIPDNAVLAIVHGVGWDDFCAANAWWPWCR